MDFVPFFPGVFSRDVVTIMLPIQPYILLYFYMYFAKINLENYYNDNRIVFPGDYDFLNISKPAFRYFKDEDEKKQAIYLVIFL